MKLKLFALLALSFLISGCASYTTPGGAVQMSEIADTNINELMAQEPAANFPARISVARVQASGYESLSGGSYGTGRYSVVTTRDVETEEDLSRLTALPGAAGVAPLNRILLPRNLDSIMALREASARLKADILLLYTFDTSFQAGEQKYLPLNTVALGFLKNKRVTVTTTASAAFFDVRTEYLYGLAEASAEENKLASVWSTADAVDDLRVSTERAAFSKLVGEIERTWSGVVKDYGQEGI